MQRRVPKYAPLEGLFIAREPDNDDGEYWISNADGLKVAYVAGWHITDGHIVIPPAPRPPRLGPPFYDGTPRDEEQTRYCAGLTISDNDPVYHIRRILDCCDLVNQWDAEDNA